jgi:TolA-binding protein
MGILAAVVVASIVYFVVTQVRARAREESTVLIEGADEIYFDWLSAGSEEKSRVEEDLNERLDLLIRQYPRQYGGQRALFLRGRMFLENGETQQALEVFQRLSSFAERSYLGVEGLMNVAVLEEELGNTDGALATYRQLIEEHPKSAYVPHALFSIGRILESQPDVEAAMSTYQRLRAEHPSSGWTDFATNRIIALEAMGEVKTE